MRVVVDEELEVAERVLEQQRSLRHRDCAAFTRRGTPCRRAPLADSDFCPSHMHLESVLRPSAEQVLAEERALADADATRAPPSAAWGQPPRRSSAPRLSTPPPLNE